MTRGLLYWFLWGLREGIASHADFSRHSQQFESSIAEGELYPFEALYSSQFSSSDNAKSLGGTASSRVTGSEYVASPGSAAPWICDETWRDRTFAATQCVLRTGDVSTPLTFISGTQFNDESHHDYHDDDIHNLYHDGDGYTINHDSDGYTIEHDSDGYTTNRDSDGYTTNHDSDGYTINRDSDGYTINRDSDGYTINRDSDGYTIDRVSHGVEENGELLNKGGDIDFSNVSSLGEVPSISQIKSCPPGTLLEGSQCIGHIISTPSFMCPPHSTTLADQNQCVTYHQPFLDCAITYELRGGKCVRISSSPTTLKCDHPDATLDRNRRVCERVIKATPQCPPGFLLNAKDQLLTQYQLHRDNARLDEDVVCVQEVDPQLRCDQLEGFEFDNATQQCSQQKFTLPRSECPENSVPVEDERQCVALEQDPPQCPPEFTYDVDSDHCTRDVGPVEAACPEGFDPEVGLCVLTISRPADLECPPGYALTPDSDCLQETVSPPFCPEGMRVSAVHSEACERAVREIKACPDGAVPIVSSSGERKCRVIVHHEPIVCCPLGFDLIDNHCERTELTTPELLCDGQCYRTNSYKATYACPDDSVFVDDPKTPFCALRSRHCGMNDVDRLETISDGASDILPSHCREGASAEYGESAYDESCVRESNSSSRRDDDVFCEDDPENRQLLPAMPFCPLGGEIDGKHCLTRTPLPPSHHCAIGAYDPATRSCVRRVTVPTKLNCPPGTTRQQNLSSPRGSDCITFEHREPAIICPDGSHLGPDNICYIYDKMVYPPPRTQRFPANSICPIGVLDTATYSTAAIGNTHSRRSQLPPMAMCIVKKSIPRELSCPTNSTLVTLAERRRRLNSTRSLQRFVRSQSAIAGISAEKTAEMRAGKRAGRRAGKRTRMLQESEGNGAQMWDHNFGSSVVGFELSASDSSEDFMREDLIGEMAGLRAPTKFDGEKDLTGHHATAVAPSKETALLANGAARCVQVAPLEVPPPREKAVKPSFICDDKNSILVPPNRCRTIKYRQPKLTCSPGFIALRRRNAYPVHDSKPLTYDKEKENTPKRVKEVNKTTIDDVIIEEDTEIFDFFTEPVDIEVPFVPKDSSPDSNEDESLESAKSESANAVKDAERVEKCLRVVEPFASLPRIVSSIPSLICPTGAVLRGSQCVVTSELDPMFSCAPGLELMGRTCVRAFPREPVCPRGMTYIPEGVSDATNAGSMGACVRDVVVPAKMEITHGCMHTISKLCPECPRTVSTVCRR